MQKIISKKIWTICKKCLKKEILSTISISITNCQLPIEDGSECTESHL